jgi:hypothetical protein
MRSKGYERVNASGTDPGHQNSIWRHTEQAERALTQAQEKGLSRDLAEAFLMKATEYLQESRIAIENAGKLLRS